MKTARLIMSSLIAAAGFAVTSAPRSASALKFTYNVGVQVQNLSASVATTSIAFYDATGGVAGTTNDTIPANGSKTYFPLQNVSAGFNGSAIVSSDQVVAAVVNVLGNNGVSAASYIGQAAGSTTVEIPLLMKNNSGYDTWFKVQNAGTQATNITVNYSDGTTATANNVAPSAAATFDQSTETHTPKVFAATVTSSNAQPLVATVIEENATTLFAYNGFSAGSLLPVAPLVNANNFGYITGIQIKNGGNASSDVTVSYTPAGAGNGTACTETQTIAAGQSATFALYSFTLAAIPGMTSNCARGAKFVGSAQVTTNSGNVPLSAIVNQLNSAQNKGEAYAGFDPANLGTKVVMPLIMDRNFGYFTGFNVMNVGAATTVNCTFTNNARTLSVALGAGAVMNDVQLNQMANGYVGSATCTGGAGSKLAGVVNEVAGTGDTFLVYEALNAQ